MKAISASLSPLVVIVFSLQILVSNICVLDPGVGGGADGGAVAQPYKNTRANTIPTTKMFLVFMFIVMFNLLKYFVLGLILLEDITFYVS